MDKPNILFVMTDQQRWDSMGCSGDWVKTPALDRIAAEGVRFTRCVTTTPVCIPARVTLATGRYPHNNAVWSNLRYTLPPDAPTWMRTLRGLGYRTSLFGKTHLHPHEGDLRDREHLLHAYGLDDVDEIAGPLASRRSMSRMTARWQDKGLLEAFRADVEERIANKAHRVRPSALPLEEYYDVYVGQRAKRYLESYERDEPWFCWVSFAGPHQPWDAPEPYASMYDPEAMPAPVPRPSDDRPRPRGGLDYLMEHKSPRLDPGDEAAMRANYAGNVTLIDAQVGEILDVIEERGEIDDTVIAFTSDHGEMNGDWGLINKKNFLDGALRVPMLVRTPETAMNGGSVSDALVENCDLGPTLVELAGGELKHQHFARSLCPALVAGDGHRENVLSEYCGELMLMTQGWKMALNGEGRCYLLFDRKEDPAETRNLAGLSEYKAVEDELRLMTLERLARTQLRATPQRPEPEPYRPRLGFMIVGAMRCGTTALARFLSQHPEIAMSSPKEVHLFDRPDYSPDWTPAQIDARYRHAFKEGAGVRIRGEATPIYLFFPEIARELKRYNPSLKLIVLLRDPVERALSAYYFQKRRGREPRPLPLALLIEPLRLRRCPNPRRMGSRTRVCSYRRRGLYSLQLRNLYRFFDREQVLIVCTRDLARRHDATLRRVFTFLGVTGEVRIPPETVNPADRGGKRHRLVSWLLRLSYLAEFVRMRALSRSHPAPARAGEC